MYFQHTFSSDRIGPWLIKRNILNKFSTEGGVWELPVLHVIFKEVGLLRFAVKPFKTIDFHSKSKGFAFRINNAPKVLAFRFDQFKRRL